MNLDLPNIWRLITSHLDLNLYQPPLHQPARPVRPDSAAVATKFDMFFWLWRLLVGSRSVLAGLVA
jgi:hypothetical protein